MSSITRFAPSPTGFLHIGGARTALFNYLFARHTGGKFLLRIEDTDLQRSTVEAVDAIINGLAWLNLKPDEKPVFQMQRQSRHIEAALKLLETDNAYKCYCTKEDLERRRSQAEKEGKVYTYDGRCRNSTNHENYKDMPFTLRLKVNKEGSTVINDIIKGKTEVKNDTLDDFIILRSDNTPTYMFAVVVDDHDMNITHVIRGDDHFTNTFRQYQIYKAFNWETPEFAHLPLIHATDGSKLSKRHGAVSIESYKDLGFLPEAIINYLLKLGWSHGDDEIISSDQAIKWFDITDVHSSPAKFDMVKLTSINHHYIQNTSNEKLLEIMEEFITKDINDLNKNYKSYLLKGLTYIKERSKTILELIENSSFYIKNSPFILSDNATEVINNSKEILEEQLQILKELTYWTKDNIHLAIQDYCKEKSIKLGKASEGLRVALTGKTISASSNFDIMIVLGKEETLSRISTVLD